MRSFRLHAAGVALAGFATLALVQDVAAGPIATAPDIGARPAEDAAAFGVELSAALSWHDGTAAAPTPTPMADDAAPLRGAVSILIGALSLLCFLGLQPQRVA
ncbi:MAG: hypothetical protein ACK5MQ_10525 [Pikeienuella sp.]